MMCYKMSSLLYTIYERRKLLALQFCFAKHILSVVSDLSRDPRPPRVMRPIEIRVLFFSAHQRRRVGCVAAAGALPCPALRPLHSSPPRQSVGPLR
jgi:hypothetical protein